MIRHTRKVERVRLPDGSRVPLTDGMFADRSARSALTVASNAGGTALAISGAAVAAVTADDMEPMEEALVRFDSWRENPYTPSMTAAPLPSVRTWESAPGMETDAGPDGPVTPGSTLARDYPIMHTFQLDVDTLDTVGVPYPAAYWHGAGELATVSYWPAEPLDRLVRNAEALPAGTAWTTSGGVYTRPVDATAPEDPWDPSGDRYVHHLAGASAGSTLTSPGASHVAYARAAGRPFLVVAWVKASAAVEVRASMVIADATGAVVMATLESEVQAVGTEWARHVFTVRDDYAGWQSAQRHRRHVVLEVVAGSGDVSVRLPHAYAGLDDRGDAAGLRAVPTPHPIGKRMAVTSEGRPRLVNRVDVTGDGGHGAVTAFSSIVSPATGAGSLQLATHGGPGDGCARFATPVPLLPAPDDGAGWTLGGYLDVSVEEVDTGPGGFVWVFKMEPSYEVNLTPDLLRMTVDRTADADPTDSTTPLGNYAAAELQLDLDNTDGKWSPFRVDYLSVAHQVEAAVGVVYTNRHGDPDAAGLDAAAWVAEEVGAVPPDLGGVVPSRRRAARSAGGDVWACHPVGPGQRWEVGALLAGDGDAWVGLDTGDNVDGPIPVTPGTWVPYRAILDIPADAPEGAVLRVGIPTSTGDAWVADPIFTRLDPDNGDAVIEVAEAAPAGVFYVTAWPMDTGSAAVQVAAVDALAMYGNADTAAELRRDVYLSDVLADLTLSEFDIPPAAQVIPASDGAMPWVLPPTTQLSTFMADLAKAEARSLYIDGLGRLVAQQRQYVETETSGEYRDDNAAITLATPLSLDMVRNRVRVIGSTVRPESAPVTVGLLGEEAVPNLNTWKATSGEYLTIRTGRSATYTLFFDNAAAVADVELASGYAFAKAQYANPSNRPLDNRLVELDPDNDNVTGGWLGYRITAYPTFVTVFLKAGGTPGGSGFDMYLPHFRLTGLQLQEADVTETVTRDASVLQYGDRPVEVPVRLVTNPDFLLAVGVDVLDTWALVGSDGAKWLPDLQVEALGDPWRELGDRVLAAEPVSGIGGEYRVVSHTYDTATGAVSGLYLRQVPSGLTFMALDVDTLDGPAVLGY